MSERAVLEANEKFYRSFSERDSATLEALWAQRAPVACIHPGWPVLRGRDNVIASWRSILSGPGSPRIAATEVHADVLGTTALVTCYENLPTGKLVATNIFVEEDGEWRMVHHQAGAVSPAFEADDDDDPAETLH